MDTETHSIDKIPLFEEHLERSGTENQIALDGEYVYKTFRDYYQFLKELSFNQFLRDYGNYPIFVSGDYDTLTLTLRRGVPLDTSTLLTSHCLGEIVEKIYYLHSMGIVHGDIKISNFIFYQGKIEVIDFGASRFTRKPIPLTSPLYSESYRPRDNKVSEFGEVYCLGRLFTELFYKVYDIRVPLILREMLKSQMKKRCSLARVREVFVPEEERKVYTCTYYQDKIPDPQKTYLQEFEERLLTRTDNIGLMKYAEMAISMVVKWIFYKGSTENFQDNEYREFIRLLRAEDFYPFSRDL